MSRTYVFIADRRFVQDRARNRCEYCLIHEDDTGYGSRDTEFGCEVDHIIAEKHGGETTHQNLAYACPACNRNKGSDVALLSYGGVVTRLFHPRTDVWAEHFRIERDRLVPLTTEAESTERILLFNDPDRCEERAGLQVLGRYPLTAPTSTTL